MSASKEPIEKRRIIFGFADNATANSNGIAIHRGADITAKNSVFFIPLKIAYDTASLDQIESS